MKPSDVGLLREVGDPRVSPDGSAVAFTVSDPDLELNRYVRRIWVTSTSPGEDGPLPFTGEGYEFLPRWSPDGRLLAFVVDRDNGWSEICTLAFRGNGERLVVCRWFGRVSDLAWSPDGTRIAFIGREADVGHYGEPGNLFKDKDMAPRRITRLRYRYNGSGWTFDRPSKIFVVDVDGSARPRSVTSGPFQVEGLSWSPNSSSIAFASGRHDTWDLDLAVDLWLVPTDDEPIPERLTEGKSAYSHPSWSPDGSRLAYLSNATPLESSRHRQVGLLDLATYEQLELTGSLDRNCAPHGSVRGPIWVGEFLLFGVEDHGNINLYQVPSDSSAVPQIVIDGPCWVSEWDFAQGLLAYVVSSPNSLPELATLAISSIDTLTPPSRGDQATLLTSFTRPLAKQIKMATPERFVAHSQDGAAVECWAMRPVGVADGVRSPALLNVHGGPFTQYGNHLFDEFQFQTSAGFGVLYCNPRGSSGYSEAWGRAVRWPECEQDPGSGWGGVDFNDVMACVDEACRSFDWIDSERLGILGGSYGGYMTSWAIAHTDRFKAACSERACNNLLTMEHNMDIAGFIRSYVGRDHIESPEIYLRQSPVTYVKAMTTPLLLIHSEDDLRCPINQAEELFVGLRLSGRGPEMIRFPGENHDLSRSGAPRHRTMRAQIIIDWFTEHLIET